jgi:flagellar basal-body rod protein FlgG
MVRGLYVAANSLLVQEAAHDTIATNLANVSTPGYRRAVPSVESFPAVLGRVASQPDLLRQGFVGQGAAVLQSLSTAEQAVPHLSARQTTDFTPGAHQQTDNPCDLALDGPGFFVVQAATSEAYTRAGSFTLDNEGYLTTPGGHRLMGEAGAIKVSGRNWSVTPKGDVVCDGAVVDRVRVVDFEGKQSLSRLGDNLFAAGDMQPVAVDEVAIRQGYIEGSNVNAVSEMVNMITALRAFETNQKVIQAVDSTLDRVINEVGRV